MANSIQEFFDALPSKLEPARLAGMNAKFQFVATGDNGGDWYVSIANGAANVGTGKVESPTIVLTAAAADWLALMNGQMNGQTAFITGKLKIQGDMTLAMKLESLFQLG
jgi:putative sterol carrier protein